MATEPPDIPQGMRRVHRRFARWRSAHPGVRLPIPGPLWASAAEVAREHGVGRTAQLLRLEYGKLKRLAESGSAAAKATGGSNTAGITRQEMVYEAIAATSRLPSPLKSAATTEGQESPTA